MTEKFVIFGHTGFIGSRVAERLRQLLPNASVTGASLSGVDLTDPASAATVSDLLTPDTSVVMCAAIKRQLGDSADIYLRNTAIVVNFAKLIADNPVRRVVYLSSGAVYGEDIENLAITEDTPLVPRSYYGLSKITAEWILQRTVDTLPATSLGLLRPATIYGPGDVATAYGPSGFLNSALSGRPITLWGDGSELREFLFIDDVVELTARYVATDHTGPLNVASGVSYTFRDAIEAVGTVVGSLPEVSSKPRSKAKVDNRYDTSRLRELFPDIAFTPLLEGLRRTCQERLRDGTRTS